MSSERQSPAPRVVIVGAGPAGMRAAMVLAEAGLRPVVLDEAARGGGQIYRRPPPGFSRSRGDLYGFEAGRARRLHDGFDALRDRIDYRPASLVWSVSDGAVHVLRAGRGERVPFDRLLLATGAMDRVIPFEGWTMPGVWTLGGAQIALKAQGCAVGRRVVFFGSSPLMALVAHQYAKAGAEVVAVLDTASLRLRIAALPGLIGHRTGRKGLWYVARLAARGIVYRHGITPLKALGSDGVTGFAWTDADGRRREIACDAIAFGYGLSSEAQLADLAGCRFGFDTATHAWAPEQDALGRSSVPGVYLAGDGARIRGADVAELTGERAARAILADCGDTAQRAALEWTGRALEAEAPLRRTIDAAFPFPAQLARDLPEDCILCRCEAVTAGAFRAAIRGLGAHEINRAKAFSRVGMGRCQGRVCGPAAAEITAAVLGCDSAGAGRLRAQPPVKPVPVGMLSGDGETAP